MSSFLDKLKKGMGVEITADEEPAFAKASAGKEEKPMEEKVKPVQKRKKPKKLEIKTEPVEAAEQKTEERKEKEVEIKKEKWFEQEGQLAVDVYETNGELIIQSAIAGVKPEELDISIENDRVLIKGERAEQVKEEGKNYFYQECYWGQFSREIILPVETDPSRAEALMKNGILTIRMPKIEREKKRKIEVKA